MPIIWVLGKAYEAATDALDAVQYDDSRRPALRETWEQARNAYANEWRRLNP